MPFTPPKPKLSMTHPGFGDLEAEGVHNPFRDWSFPSAAAQYEHGWRAVAKAAPEQTRAFHEGFREHLKHATPAIMVPGRALQGILESGRVKSQFETGSSGGVESREARSRAEKRQFGYPLDHPDHARPLYGYLTRHPYTDTSVDTWGPHTIVLKPENVWHRTTFTGHDSLDPIAHVTPMPVSAYRRAAVPLQTVGLYHDDIENGEYEPEDLAEHMKHRDPVQDADKYWAGEREWGARYPEAQYHGGLRLGDISHVILRSMGKKPGQGMNEDSTKQAASLTRAGIPWVHTGGYNAPTDDDPWFTPRTRQ